MNLNQDKLSVMGTNSADNIGGLMSQNYYLCTYTLYFVK